MVWRYFIRRLPDLVIPSFRHPQAVILNLFQDPGSSFSTLIQLDAETSSA
jgi:hypothetical protein